MDESGPDPTFAIDGELRPRSDDLSEITIPGSNVNLVYNSDLNAACGGGQLVRDCPTTQALLSRLTALLSRRPLQPSPNEGTLWNSFPGTEQNCSTCGQSCSLAAQTYQGQPTEKLRFGFVRRDPSADVVKLYLPPYDRPS